MRTYCFFRPVWSLYICCTACSERIVITYCKLSLSWQLVPCSLETKVSWQVLCPHLRCSCSVCGSHSLTARLLLNKWRNTRTHLHIITLTDLTVLIVVKFNKTLHFFDQPFLISFFNLANCYVLYQQRTMCLCNIAMLSGDKVRFLVKTLLQLLLFQ